MFDGPSVYSGDRNLFPEKLADAMVPGGHMAMISDHYYPMGNGRAAEKNLPSARAHFLSNDTDTRFGKAFAAVGSKLMAKGIPYRIDELNSCFQWRCEGGQRYLHGVALGARRHPLVGGAPHPRAELSHGRKIPARWHHYGAELFRLSSSGRRPGPRNQAAILWLPGFRPGRDGTAAECCGWVDFSAAASPPMPIGPMTGLFT